MMSLRVRVFSAAKIITCNTSDKCASECQNLIKMILRSKDNNNTQGEIYDQYGKNWCNAFVKPDAEWLGRAKSMTYAANYTNRCLWDAAPKDAKNRPIVTNAYSTALSIQTVSARA